VPELEARAVVPALAVLLALRVVDAYVRPGERPALARMRDVLLAVGVPLVAQIGSSTPLRALGLGAVVSVVLVAGLRMLFPPLVNRPAGATGPAFWLRLDVDGIDVSVVMLAIAALGLVVLVAIK
jgi:hypothetical protein